MAINYYYLIRSLTINPPFYGGNQNWVSFNDAQSYSSKEAALTVIETLTNGDYTIQEKIVKS
jgi:hypothetical protein